MKNLIIIVFFLLTGLQLVAQETAVPLDDSKIYSFVQEKACPINGK